MYYYEAVEANTECLYTTRRDGAKVDKSVYSPVVFRVWSLDLHLHYLETC